MQLYACVGSNDLSKSLPFYGALLGEIGWEPLFDNPSGGRFFGSVDDGIFGVVTPFNDGPATVGNGTMIGFSFPNQQEVNQFYMSALALGAADEGKPGDRGGGYYFAYFRDLEGNKLCAWTSSPT